MKARKTAKPAAAADSEPAMHHVNDHPDGPQQHSETLAARQVRALRRRFALSALRARLVADVAFAEAAR